MIKKYLNRPTKLKNTVLQDDEPIVQNGLAVTPRDMLNMTLNGIPISPSNLGLQFDEGYSKLDFEPPLHTQRGVDISDMWEQREDFKGKLKSKEFKSYINSLENAE